MIENYSFKMANVTRWYEENEKTDVYRKLKPGDLVEFDRRTYRHWAVFVGTMIDFSCVLKTDFTCSLCTREADKCRCHRCYVVHRANPGDSNALGFVSKSKSVSKGLNGIGTVILESMDDVWAGCKARKNNLFDQEYPAIPTVRVLGRAFRLFNVHLSGEAKNDDYNLITNNCEHFACWCRYGRKESTQVKKGAVIAGVTTVGVVAGITAAAYWYPGTPKDTKKTNGDDGVKQRLGSLASNRPPTPYPNRYLTAGWNQI